MATYIVLQTFKNPSQYVTAKYIIIILKYSRESKYSVIIIIFSNNIEIERKTNVTFFKRDHTKTHASCIYWRKKGFHRYGSTDQTNVLVY